MNNSYWFAIIITILGILMAVLIGYMYYQYVTIHFPAQIEHIIGGMK